MVCGSRLYLIDGSSSSRRCMDVLILSSSPRLLGSIAYDSTGSGNTMAGNVTGSALSPSVSLVSVSLSFATAPRSPALISGTLVCVLPWSSATWPSRSCAVARLVVDRRVGLEGARDHAKHRDAPGERIGDRLPHERQRRLLVVGGAGDVAAVPVHPRVRPVGRRRQVADDGVEQLRDADVDERGGADAAGTALAAAVALRRPVTSFLVGQRAGFEELLHQLLVGLGHHLDQGLARGVHGAGHLRRHGPSVNEPLPSVLNRKAFRVTRSTTPRKFFSSPIGS